MKINLNDVLYAFSYALDCVEHELLGAATNHGKRVAYISTILGRSLGFDNETLFDLAACAVLHDNALTEYLKTEFNKEHFERAEKNELGIHCRIGEENIKNLPFHKDVTGVILYHHENVDGSGPFGKTAEETPLMAQLIHFADVLDVTFNLGIYQEGKEKKIRTFLLANENTLFASEHIKLFLENFTPENLKQIQGEHIDLLLKTELPECIQEYSGDTLYSIATMFATIIDYKSEITSKHSLGIAQKAMAMAQDYGYDEETSQRLYLAGAVHDIGKLIISKDILEKPAKLNAWEYEYVQTHVWYTYAILKQIKGFEDIAGWASLHHEKLNGKGYPFGKTAAELGVNERMMACLDIYQALTETRSYKKSMSHDSAMIILRKMVCEGALDSQIVEDIDRLFGSL
ncbi:MAG: HD domain-containing protein [Clostridium sp.]